MDWLLDLMLASCLVIGLVNHSENLLDWKLVNCLVSYLGLRWDFCLAIPKGCLWG